MKILFFIVGILSLGLIIFYMWRWISRSKEAPCPFWLSWFVELDNPFTKHNRAHTIIEYANVKKGMHVIDFGCGPGRLTIPLAKKVGPSGKVTAVDLQSNMLKRVKQKAHENQLENITYIQANIGAQQHSFSFCDRAFLVTVLGEIPKKQVALQEIYDTLKPGGILTITEVIFDPHFQKKDSVFHLAHQVGFREQGFFGHRFAYSLLLKKPL